MLDFFSFPVLSPIRAISIVDPVKGTANPDISCGHNAQNAAILADANPGSTVSFKWANGIGGHVRICIFTLP